MSLILAYLEMLMFMGSEKNVVKVRDYEEMLERKDRVQRFFEWLLMVFAKYGEYESFEE